MKPAQRTLAFRDSESFPPPWVTEEWGRFCIAYENWVCALSIPRSVRTKAHWAKQEETWQLFRAARARWVRTLRQLRQEASHG